LAPEPALVNIWAARRDVRYVSADLRMRSVMVRADATAMPFRDNAFSLLLASHVLEHLPCDAPALEEIARVAAPGGQVLILVPTLPKWDERATVEFGVPDPRLDDHWRIYGADVIERIAARGLMCKAISFSSFVSPEQRRAYRIEEDVIFAARKP